MKDAAGNSSPLEEDDNIADLPSGLSEKQEAVIAALLSHPTIRQAAATCGISETTIWRYLQNPVFKEHYHDARRQVVEHVVLKLQHDAGTAAAVLLEVAQDKQASAGARVSAARAILDQSMRSIKQDELQARVERIEAHLEQKSRELPPAEKRGTG